MDGGRVLRALLAFRLGRRRATEIAARIGQGLAFVFGFLGLMSGNAILVFIAIFVFLAAAGEAGDVGLRETARRVPVDRAMVTAFESLGTAGDRRRGRRRADPHDAARVPGRRRRRPPARLPHPRRDDQGAEGDRPRQRR